MLITNTHSSSLLSSSSCTGLWYDGIHIVIHLPQNIFRQHFCFFKWKYFKYVFIYTQHNDVNMSQLVQKVHKRSQEAATTMITNCPDECKHYQALTLKHLLSLWLNLFNLLQQNCQNDIFQCSQWQFFFKISSLVYVNQLFKWIFWYFCFIHKDKSAKWNNTSNILLLSKFQPATAAAISGYTTQVPLIDRSAGSGKMAHSSPAHLVRKLKTCRWHRNQLHFTHWGWDKMAAIFTGHFATHLSQWKCLHFHSNFT